MANPERKNHQPSPDDINRFLDLQEADIKVRGQEVVLRGKEIDANAKNAEKSIEAQLQIEQLRQQAFLSQNKSRSWLIGILIVGGIAVILTAILWDKEQVAIELLKQAAIVAGSFATGYAVGHHKKPE